MSGGSGDAPTKPQQEAACTAIGAMLLRLTLSLEQPSVHWPALKGNPATFSRE